VRRVLLVVGLAGVLAAAGVAQLAVVTSRAAHARPSVETCSSIEATVR
jgi:hypothetical protein